MRFFKKGSIRAPWWNYGWSGTYFFTAITLGRFPFFGSIQNQIMCLNEIGTFAWQSWFETKSIRADMNLHLDAFIVMPDHIHGLLHIGQNHFNRNQLDHQKHSIYHLNQFGSQSKNLPSIIRGLKGSITRKARRINPDFAWQKLYHDEIIQTKEDYFKIRNYILNNPQHHN